MTRAPRTIAPDALVAEALELISRKISALLVVENGEVVGIVHFHDLLRVGRPSGAGPVRRARPIRFLRSPSAYGKSPASSRLADSRPRSGTLP